MLSRFSYLAKWTVNTALVQYDERFSKLPGKVYFLSFE